MNVIDKAKSAFGKGIKFNIEAGLVSPEATLPRDANGETNCLNFVAWSAGIDLTDLPYPRIKWIYDHYDEAAPAPGVLLCRPPQKLALGTIAIVSQVSNGQVSALILAHPNIDGILGEVTGSEIVELKIFRPFLPFRCVSIPGGA